MLFQIIYHKTYFCTTNDSRLYVQKVRITIGRTSDLYEYFLVKIQNKTNFEKNQTTISEASLKDIIIRNIVYDMLYCALSILFIMPLLFCEFSNNNYIKFLSVSCVIMIQRRRCFSVL
jgi:hypothetical protein